LAVTALFIANVVILEAVRHCGAELNRANNLAAARRLFLSPVFLIVYAFAIGSGLTYLYQRNKKKPLLLRQKALVLAPILGVSGATC
jgi:hypothetical protein